MINCIINNIDLLNSNDQLQTRKKSIVITTNHNLCEKYLFIYKNCITYNFGYSWGTIRVYDVFDSDEYVIKVYLQSDTNINEMRDIYEKLERDYYVDYDNTEIIYFQTISSKELKTRIEIVFKGVIVENNNPIRKNLTTTP